MMMMRRFAKAVMITITAVPLGMLLVSVVGAVVEDALTVYPTPATQSAFMRTYTPAPVFEHYRCSRYSSHEVDGTSSGAGHGFAMHEREFEPFFIMQSRQRMVFMAALAEDISTGLTNNGATIIGRSGNTADGFQVQYASGKSIGSIMIEPPKDLNQSQVTGRERLCPGEAPVSIRIRIEEKWVKSGV